MAGEHSGDALFYDFLIEDPEMPTPTTMSTIPTLSNTPSTMPSTMSTSTPGATAFAAAAAPANIATDPPHIVHLQQPISAPNRTSPQPQRHLPMANDPRTPRHPVTLHVASPVAAAPLPAQAAQLQATHVGAQPTFLPLELDPASRAQSRPLLQSHHAAIHDLHAHHPQSPAPLAAASFPVSLPPTSASPVAPGPVEWSMYGVPQHPMALNPSPFEFEVPGAIMMPSMSQHGHMSAAVSDPSLGYGGGIVSPSSIHSSQNHYGFSGSWEDHLVHESATPTVSTPSGQVSANPWTDPEDLQQEIDFVHDTRPKKAPRPRRTKKDARRSSDTRSGPSPDAVSPGSTSQNSRASIGSKSTSITSSSAASSSVASSSSSRLSKLRSASRTSKNSHSKPNDTVEERRTRASHNLVEKQYRNRLNAQFESLLNALPEQARAGGDSDSDNGWSDRKVSKGEVLEMARKHIQSLELERDMLERENSELQGSLAQLKNATTSEGSGQDTPLDFHISMDDDKEDGHLN